MARSTARLMISGLLGATVLALTGCGNNRGSSVAVGYPAPAPAVSTPANSGVVFVPLDSPAPTPAPTSGGSSAPSVPNTSGAPAGSSTAGGTTGGGTTPSTPPRSSGGSGGGKSGGTSTGGGTGSGGGTGKSTGGGGSTGGAGGGTGAPQTPASLAVTALHTADTAQRWCQRVTLTLANSGDRAATSGTVTFATHVIGVLGIDWWTYQTSQSLTVPVAGHATVNESWTVCLDAWRVPLGMHLETRAATLL